MQHVPPGETRELELLPFEDALRQALEPAPDYDVTRWLYVPKVYGEYRYVLGTRGKHPLICMGINPSTAIPDRLDNTLKSVERIALANGFDSFLMFNVYAQRATDPDAMEPRCNARLHRENLRAFQYLLSLHPQPAGKDRIRTGERKQAGRRGEALRVGAQVAFCDDADDGLGEQACHAGGKRAFRIGSIL